MVTNDFPPRIGGIQQYEWNLALLLPDDRVAVLGRALARGGVPYVSLPRGGGLGRARVPGSRSLLARALGHGSAVPATSESTAAAVRRAVPAGVPSPIGAPAVDESRFSPAV